jgi:hypothetical protein
MDRSPANLGDIINSIQRDLDELKMAQATNASATIMSFSDETVENDDWIGTKGLNYIKYPNGLMIVTGQSGVIQVSDNAYKDLSFELETPFVDYPVVLTSVTTNSQATSIVSVSNNYSTSYEINLRIYNKTGSGRSPLVSFIAIGRWSLDGQ